MIFCKLYAILFSAILHARSNDGNEENVEKDFDEICEELAQFTPNLCNNARATEKCTNICSDAAAQGT